ncbi:MAG: glycosyltransferase family 2 protein [Anaerolineae bacterium]|nr:glycosyltransferase family 2 protein [Anaerolineae bacterium]MCA9887518.1 glycosyltransferase family 2 protein [Anaerolineae bacterium]MCA9893929.1 glycosyltransferase family 2 protein [Anaerolineae bacterium]MCB9460915.1 glycosyltransferase family 2 protein [Anaerolineaceae bacterium]
MRTLVALLAFNEERNIGRVVRNIRNILPEVDVLVVNDGSNDGTEAVARESGAIVLTMPHNVGIGAAEQAAFRFAARYGYRLMVRNDGDGQHEAADIPMMLDTMATQPVDIVIGSRFIGEGDYGTPPTRRMGILIITGLLRLLTRQPITDPTSGFRAFNHRAITCFAQIYPQDYPEPETIVMAHRLGLRMVEVPVRFHMRQHGRSQFLNIRTVIYYMFKVLLAIVIDSMRRDTLPETVTMIPKEPPVPFNQSAPE